MANLVAEFTKGAEKKVSKEHPRVDREVMIIFASPLPYWELYMDEAANQRGSGVGIDMISQNELLSRNP